jgi:hypothetical protein
MHAVEKRDFHPIKRVGQLEETSTEKPKKAAS